MTLITFEDGKVVFRDGAVGTEQACCCGGPPVCVCPESCVEALEITFGESGEGPLCFETFAGDIEYSDTIFVDVLQFSVFLSCIDGQWSARVQGCGPGCTIGAIIDLDCDTDNLPVARQITNGDWTVTFLIGDCGTIPTAEIVK